MARHPWRLALVALAASALVTGACGDGGDASMTTLAPLTSADASKPVGTTETTARGISSGDYVAEVARVMSTSIDLEFLDGPSLYCIAEALVDVVGVERLDAEGITPEHFAVAQSFVDLGLDVDDDEAAVERLAAAFEACGDLRRLLAAGIPEGSSCLLESMDPSLLARSFARDSLTGSTSDVLMTMFESASPACIERALIDEMKVQGELSDADAACFADVLDDEVAVRLVIASSGGEAVTREDQYRIVDAYAQCGLSR
jgi:hypothetical protein